AAVQAGSGKGSGGSELDSLIGMAQGSHQYRHPRVAWRVDGDAGNALEDVSCDLLEIAVLGTDELRTNFSGIGIGAAGQGGRTAALPLFAEAGITAQSLRAPPERLDHLPGSFS